MSHTLPLTAGEIEKRLLKISDLAVHAAIHSGTNIQVVLDHFIEDGSEIKFKAPTNCSNITRLLIHYTDLAGNDASKLFAFADANGNDIGEVSNLFAEGAIVKVVLDLDSHIDDTDGVAFVQNADTNAYLESRFSSLEASHSTINADAALEDLVSIGLVDPLCDNNNKIFVSENNDIYIL